MGVLKFFRDVVQVGSTDVPNDLFGSFPKEQDVFEKILKEMKDGYRV